MADPSRDKPAITTARNISAGAAIRSLDDSLFHQKGSRVAANPTGTAANARSRQEAPTRTAASATNAAAPTASTAIRSSPMNAVPTARGRPASCIGGSMTVPLGGHSGTLAQVTVLRLDRPRPADPPSAIPAWAASRRQAITFGRASQAVRTAPTGSILTPPPRDETARRHEERSRSPVCSRLGCIPAPGPGRLLRRLMPVTDALRAS